MSRLQDGRQSGRQSTASKVLAAKPPKEKYLHLAKSIADVLLKKEHNDRNKEKQSDDKQEKENAQNSV